MSAGAWFGTGGGDVGVDGVEPLGGAGPEVLLPDPPPHAVNQRKRIVSVLRDAIPAMSVMFYPERIFLDPTSRPGICRTAVASVQT